MNTQQPRTSAWVTLISLIFLLALLTAFNSIEGNAAQWGIRSLIFLGILFGAVQTMKNRTSSRVSLHPRFTLFNEISS